MSLNVVAVIPFFLVQFPAMPGLGPIALAALAGSHLRAILLCGADGPPFDLLEAWSQPFFDASTWICLPQFAVTAVVSRETLFALPLSGSILSRDGKAPSLKGTCGAPAGHAGWHRF